MKINTTGEGVCE